MCHVRQVQLNEKRGRQMRSPTVKIFHPWLELPCLTRVIIGKMLISRSFKSWGRKEDCFSRLVLSFTFVWPSMVWQGDVLHRCYPFISLGNTKSYACRLAEASTAELRNHWVSCRVRKTCGFPVNNGGRQDAEALQRGSLFNQLVLSFRPDWPSMIGLLGCPPQVLSFRKLGQFNKSYMRQVGGQGVHRPLTLWSQVADFTLARLWRDDFLHWHLTGNSSQSMMWSSYGA